MLKVSFEDIEGKSVCDLGAGCGMLSCGAALLQASNVIGIEVDPDALEIFSENIEVLQLTNVNPICGDILSGLTDG